MSVERARALRKTATKAERLLRHHLCGKRSDSMRFRFQHPLGVYIVDFYCSAAKLVIEIDGSSHDDKELYDANREAWLRSEGYDIIRFTNSAVLANPSFIAEQIAQVANRLISNHILRMRSATDSPKRIEMG